MRKIDFRQNLQKINSNNLVMKNIRKYFLLTFAITISFNLFAQHNSWDGCGIKPNSKFRILNFFINVIYEEDSLNNKYPGEDWPRAYNEGVNNEAIPNYLLGFMDTVYVSQNNGILTRLFGEASFDSLQMIGDFVVVNVKESRVLTFPIVNNNYCQNTAFCYNNIIRAAIQLINEKGGLETLYGRNNIDDYDYENKEQIYFAQTMIRNISKEYGGISRDLGFGGANMGSSKIKIGNKEYSFSGKGTCQCIGSGDMSNNITSIIRHEITHSLLGSNSFHTSGGNHRGSTERMPFLTLQGGHGLFGGSGLVCTNGYERWRMHWRYHDAPYYISAHGHANSDIKKEDGNRSFYLRDFVTFGDAIRIKLPYKDSERASNQYIWLENHQVGKYGRLDFLQFSNLDVDCRPEGMPGIYAYYQIGRDTLSGSYATVWDTHERDNLKIISAEGYWNYSVLPVNPYKIDCINYGWHDYILERKEANPFCGYQDQEVQIHPFPSDNIIKLNHSFPMWRKKIETNIIDSLPGSGDNRDPFSVYSKINMSTNPSTCNAKTYYNYLFETGLPEYTEFAYKNNETSYLSGLSIEMIPQSNNTIFVNIRWDDYDISNSANWTGKIALKEKAILKNGHTIHLKQNKTPAQFTRDAESGLFAKISLFTCEPNSEFLQEPNTIFIVDEKSKMIIKSGAKYTIDNNAKLIVENGTLTIEDGADFFILGTGELIINNNSTVFIFNVTKLDIDANIYIQPGGKLIVDGGTLTNACPGEMWQGIIVEGDPNQPIQPQVQGFVQLKNNSKIENAITGINVSRGGIVSVSQSHFVNNKTGVKFEPLRQSNL